MAGPSPSPAATVGPLLTHLLTSNARYRRLWQAQVRRDGTQVPNIAAVARVIALHLWDAGLREESEEDLDRSIKDRLRRALAGENASAETLEWFIGAFHMSEDDRQHLWNAFAGIEPGTSEADAEWSGTLWDAPPLALPQEHRTVAVFELATVDSDGSIRDRQIRQVIQATVSGYTTFPVTYVKGAEGVEVVSGGHLGEVVPHGRRLELGLIDLGARLDVGQTHAVEYRVRYPPGRPADTEYRRTVRNRVANLDLKVRFHPRRRPAEVAWAVWASPTAPRVLAREVVPLGAEGIAHRFVPTCYGAVVGFEWSWGAPRAEAR